MTLTQLRLECIKQAVIMMTKNGGQQSSAEKVLEAANKLFEWAMKPATRIRDEY